MPSIEIINPVEFPGWDNLLLSTNDYSFFHSSTWASVVCESYKYEPLYFVSMANSKISTLIPIMEVKSLLTGKRGVSLPFTDYCASVISHEADFFDVIKDLIDYGKKSSWKYIELRGVKILPSDIPPSNCYYTHTLKLCENEEEMFRKLRSSTKRNVKKANKEGVEVKICSSPDSIQEFYRLNCITRKKHGLPPQPYYFFKMVFDHIISENRGIIVLASYQKRIIAANVYFHFGKKAVYKYGASDPRYQHLRANNLVMWEAIKWYCQNGYKSFCFGRTEPENKGLLQFKSGWGSEQELLKYYKYNFRKENFVSNDSKNKNYFNTIFNKMPIPLLRLIGTVLYPHMG